TPNGMAITADGTALVVAETRAGRLTAYVRSASDGSLGVGRPFAGIEPGFPDGMCLDAEGAAWVATLDGGRFVRVREGGAVTASPAATPSPARWAARSGRLCSCSWAWAILPGSWPRAILLAPASTPSRSMSQAPALHKRTR